ILFKATGLPSLFCIYIYKKAKRTVTSMTFWVVYAVFSVAAVTVTIFVLGKSEKPVKTAFKSSALGIVSLFAINALCSFTGIEIAVNWITVTPSVLLGLAGTVLTLAVRLLTQ
ncbi:MAG: pro-sigmaK processing inhibitor BofA family protein, partial [Oscillospiraceae bacterium]